MSCPLGELTVMIWVRRLRTCSTIFVCLAAAAACGSVEESPTAPTPVSQPRISTPAPAPAPAPAPTPAPPPAAGTPGALEVTISPNPVPWSNEPAPNCNLANRWHYEQTLRNTGGTGLTISDRADSFDGVEVSKRSGLGVVLAPGAATKIATNWCSSNNVEHRAQTNFGGSDDRGNRVTVTGTSVRLLPR